ncbi:hypothetical protein FF100_22775 [Methylobacterium terricola]|uniref:Uncharacterized protein n=1 Tax=Methylobacterium terricola TaxID=2583531 RepID=A0A5C4LC88_9HYPH|nr:hypothetical protein [Methylobacterium terricola]TNC10491.1 hypothetical protein FF100_22775 [Methylobacterium terricola]
MRPAWLSIPVTIGLVLSGPALARGSAFPTYSTPKTCALERRPGPDASAASYRGCISDEHAARRSLRRRWATFPASDRQECRQESDIGGTPSYVALLTCLQLADGTLPTEPPPLPAAR